MESPRNIENSDTRFAADARLEKVPTERQAQQHVSPALSPKNVSWAWLLFTAACGGLLGAGGATFANSQNMTVAPGKLAIGGRLRTNDNVLELFAITHHPQSDRLCLELKDSLDRRIDLLGEDITATPLFWIGRDETTDRALICYRWHHRRDRLEGIQLHEKTGARVQIRLHAS